MRTAPKAAFPLQAGPAEVSLQRSLSGSCQHGCKTRWGRWLSMQRFAPSPIPPSREPLATLHVDQDDFLEREHHERGTDH